MRCLYIVVIMVFIMTFAVSVNAQLYEYRDSEGNMRYTDDLGKVPEHRRESAGRINVIPRAYSQDDAQDAQPDDDETSPAVEGQIDPDLVAEGGALRQEEAELQEEYESIQEAIADAGDPPGSDASREAFREYNRKAEEINRRIEDYQEKLEDLENRVQEYNARFEQ